MREQEETAERNTGFKVDTVDTYMEHPTTSITMYRYSGCVGESSTLSLSLFPLLSLARLFFFSGHLTRSPSSAPAPFPLLFILQRLLRSTE